MGALRKAIHHLRRNAVAYLALFVALGGTSYAAATINGARLKNHSVTARKVKHDTLTGAEVKESKLGVVPAARSADSAKSAAFAVRAGRLGTLDPDDVVQGQGQVRSNSTSFPQGSGRDVLRMPDGSVFEAGCEEPDFTHAGYRNETKYGVRLVTRSTHRSGSTVSEDVTQREVGVGQEEYSHGGLQAIDWLAQTTDGEVVRTTTAHMAIIPGATQCTVFVQAVTSADGASG